MKNKIKRFIFRFFDSQKIYMYKKRYNKKFSLKKDIITELPLKILSEKDNHIFAGYYDINPIQGDNVLYVKKNEEYEGICICVYNLKTNYETVIDTSTAWNWQQGVRLRWKNNMENVIMYNVFEQNKYKAKIVDIYSSEVEYIDYPLYDVSGEYGITLDFERLGNLRPGYGYNEKSKENIFNDEIAIIILDLKENKEIKHLLYKEIGDLYITNIVDYQYFYINHLSFSPNGSKFIFFFIEKGKTHKAALYIYDMTTNSLKCLEKELNVSHYCWIDNENLIITAYLNNVCRYYIFKTDGERIDLLHDILIGDGHPTYIGESRFITDTYQDKMGYQKLYLIDYSSNKKIELVDIYSDYRFYGEQRCDLHPRINPSSKHIVFDANVSGSRSLYLLDTEVIYV